MGHLQCPSQSFSTISKFTFQSVFSFLHFARLSSAPDTVQQCLWLFWLWISLTMMPAGISVATSGPSVCMPTSYWHLCDGMRSMPNTCILHYTYVLRVVPSSGPRDVELQNLFVQGGDVGKQWLWGFKTVHMIIVNMFPSKLVTFKNNSTQLTMTYRGDDVDLPLVSKIIAFSEQLECGIIPHAQEVLECGLIENLSNKALTERCGFSRGTGQGSFGRGIRWNCVVVGSKSKCE